MTLAHEFDVSLPAMRLECGVELARPRLHGWCAGPVAAPDVLVVHALTGDADVASWWGPVVAPGGALDVRRYRVWSFNALGGCYGSSGPADADFPSDPADPRLPAPVTTWDQAHAILLALDALGVGHLRLATGGSVGGMVLLAAAVLAPTRFERIAPIAACAAASSWIIGFNRVARRLVLEDPSYPVARRGLELARQMAMLTYRAESGLDERQGRAQTTPGWSAGGMYRIESYLEHQGRKLAERFSAPSYLLQLGAMDHHDLDRRPLGAYRSAADGASWGLDRIVAPTLAIGISSDQLYFPSHSASLAAALRTRGVAAAYRQIESPHGHDAFLIEWDALNRHLREAIEGDLPWAGHEPPPSPSGA